MTSNLIADAIVPVSAEQLLAGIDFCDAEVVDDDLERVTITFGGRSFLVEAPDLLDAAAGLVERLAQAVMEARQDHAEQQRHVCYCHVHIDPDMETCGSRECERLAAMDRKGLIP